MQGLVQGDQHHFAGIENHQFQQFEPPVNMNHHQAGENLPNEFQEPGLQNPQQQPAGEVENENELNQDEPLPLDQNNVADQQ